MNIVRQATTLPMALYSAFQTFLCYGTLIHSEVGCGTHTS